jgi:hypothetical protein
MKKVIFTEKAPAAIGPYSQGRHDESCSTSPGVGCIIQKDSSLEKRIKLPLNVSKAHIDIER